MKEYPQVTYKKCRSLKDHLVHSHFQEVMGPSEDLKGMFRCGSCKYCDLFLEGGSFILPNCRVHRIEHFVYCQSKCVIYIALCKYGPFYIGKTFRNFWRRIYDHIYYIRKNLLFTPIGRHVTLQHKHDTSMIQFTMLERIVEDPRGGNIDKKLLQQEARCFGFLVLMPPLLLALTRP